MSAMVAASSRRAGRTPTSAIWFPLPNCPNSELISGPRLGPWRGARVGTAAGAVGTGLRAGSADPHRAPGSGTVLGGVRERPPVGGLPPDHGTEPAPVC